GNPGATVGVQGNFFNPVNQQERVTVWQKFLYVLNIAVWHQTLPSWLFSNFCNRFAISSSWRKRTAFRRHSCTGVCGVAEGHAPPWVMSVLTGALPAMCTPAAMSRWPATPALPPRVQCLPMLVLPAIPVQAAMAVPSPTFTLWAI